MSRIGRKSITIPNSVEVTLTENNLKVKGPKGVLVRTLHPLINVKIENNIIEVNRSSDDKLHRSLHGTTRSIIANMIEGVTNGYAKTLELVGVGYRAAKAGNKITLSLGFSHPVEVIPQEGIEFEVPATNKIIVKGIDKEKVGVVAAQIRSIRPPEPYKGKGVRYENEKIIRKEGKTGKK